VHDDVSATEAGSSITTVTTVEGTGTLIP